MFGKAKKPEPEAKPEPEPSQALVKVSLPKVVDAPPLVAPLSSWDAEVLRLNEQHAIIENLGGHTVIACWDPSPLDPARLDVVFQKRDSFVLRYSNQFVTITSPIGTKTFRLGEWWLAHPMRRQHRGVTFLPAGPAIIPGNILNLWTGWGCDPQPGDWSLIKDHIFVVLAGRNKEIAEYIENWIAWSIQHPDRQAEVALVLIGAKGAGKGTLVRCLQRIFGRHALQVTSRVADEAYWGGDKRCVGRLQGMITEPTLAIERKRIDVYQVRNFLHTVMVAEPGWVIPAGRYERRYAAISVNAERRGDRAYFRALHQQIDRGGAEAMMYDLQRRDLDNWHPREMPKAVLNSPEIQKQQRLNLSPLEQWYLSLLHSGEVPGALIKRKRTAYTNNLIDDARKRFPRLRELSHQELRNFLTDTEALNPICTKYHGMSANGWSFGPLAECREGWVARYGPVDWDREMEDWGIAKSQ
jgi:hypothetical protein